MAEWSGEAAAERKLDAFADALRRLALTPGKGTIRDEIAPGLRAIPAAGRGVIAFVVDEIRCEVRVLAIGCAGSDRTGRTVRRGR